MRERNECIYGQIITSQWCYQRTETALLRRAAVALSCICETPEFGLNRPLHRIPLTLRRSKHLEQPSGYVMPELKTSVPGIATPQTLSHDKFREQLNNGVAFSKQKEPWDKPPILSLT
jgi:hypothetical protein